MGKELVLTAAEDGRKVAVKSGGNTLIDYLRPWAAIPALLPTGFLAHWMWGDAGLGTGLAAAAIAAAGAGVTWMTHRLTQARTWYAHTIATATTGAGTAWLTAAVVFGAGRPMLDILIIGGVALCAIADVHLWAAGQGTGEAAVKEKAATLGKVLPSFDFAAAKLKLRNVTARVTSESEMQQRSELTLTEGATAEDVQDRRKELASIYGVAPGGVRVIEDQSRADRAELVIVKQDVMRKLIPWPGLDPALVGTSIADSPLKLGVYEDGEDFLDQLDNRHTLTVGMAGSGKSVYGKVKIVETAARADTFVCAIDLVKGRQTLGPVEGAIGWPAYDKPQARAMLDGLKRAVRARADHLASQGLGQWTKGCGLTLLHVLVEEAASAVDFDEVVDLLREARSTGIHMELSLQRATWSNLDTDARANLGDGICLGVRDEADASFVLPDYVTDAGCDPSAWRKTRPGAAYAAIEQVDVDRHTTAVKFFGPPTTRKEDENKDLAPAADSLPDQDSKLDPITRAAFGPAYADYLDTRTRKAAPAAAGAVAAHTPQVPPPAPAAAPVDRHQEDTDMQDEDHVDPIVLEDEDPDPDIECTIDDPIEMPEGASDFALAPPARTKESAEEGRRRLAAQLQLWADQGVSEKGFSAPELGRALADQQGLTRSRQWVLKELRRLEAAGRVWQDDNDKWHANATDSGLVGV